MSSDQIWVNLFDTILKHIIFGLFCLIKLTQIDLNWYV